MIDRDELINSWEIFRDKMISALTGKGKQIMLDREKVIKELDEHIESALTVDSDYVDCVRTDLLQCTVALLKERPEGEAGMTDIKETIQGLYALKTYLASKAIEENGPARESLIGMQKVVDSAVNLLKEQEARINELEGKLRLLEYGDQDILQSGLMPAT